MSSTLKEFVEQQIVNSALARAQAPEVVKQRDRINEEMRESFRQASDALKQSGSRSQQNDLQIETPPYRMMLSDGRETEIRLVGYNRNDPYSGRPPEFASIQCIATGRDGTSESLFRIFPSGDSQVSTGAYPSTIEAANIKLSVTSLVNAALSA